jgi:hypothetical protein
MYSQESRQNTLDKIIDICRAVDDIEGVLLVGSGSDQFPDIWADIDLSIVVNPSVKTREVWEALNEEFRESFDLISLGVGIYGENDYISILLLQDYLEVDAGVISLEYLEAKKDKWKILYDKQNKILAQMQQSMKERKATDTVQFVRERVSTIGHYVRTFAVGVNRNQPFRALKELEDLRNIVVEIWASQKGKVAKHFRDVDKADQDFRSHLASTYPKTIELNDLAYAFNRTIDLFFKLAEESDPRNKEIVSVKTQLRKLLETFSIEK